MSVRRRRCWLLAQKQQHTVKFDDMSNDGDHIAGSNLAHGTDVNASVDDLHTAKHEPVRSVDLEMTFIVEVTSCRVCPRDRL